MDSKLKRTTLFLFAAATIAALSYVLFFYITNPAFVNIDKKLELEIDKFNLELNGTEAGGGLIYGKAEIENGAFVINVIDKKSMLRDVSENELTKLISPLFCGRVFNLRNDLATEIDFIYQFHGEIYNNKKILLNSKYCLSLGYRPVTG